MNLNHCFYKTNLVKTFKKYFFELIQVISQLKNGFSD